MESPKIPPQNDMQTKVWPKGGREKSDLAVILAWGGPQSISSMCMYHCFS